MCVSVHTYGGAMSQFPPPHINLPVPKMKWDSPDWGFTNRPTIRVWFDEPPVPPGIWVDKADAHKYVSYEQDRFMRESQGTGL